MLNMSEPVISHVRELIMPWSACSAEAYGSRSVTVLSVLLCGDVKCFCAVATTTDAVSSSSSQEVFPTTQSPPPPHPAVCVDVYHYERGEAAYWNTDPLLQLVMVELHQQISRQRTTSVKRYAHAYVCVLCVMVYCNAHMFIEQRK